MSACAGKAVSGAAEPYRFFFERLPSLSVSAHSALGLSPEQARFFCKGVASPFLPFLTASRLNSLYAKREALPARGCAAQREAFDALFCLCARLAPGSRATLSELAQKSLSSERGAMNLSVETHPIAPASLPPERAFSLLSYLLNCSAGDARELKNEEEVADFVLRYKASLCFVISLCAEESLLDWMPSALNSICFSRLAWDEEWSSRLARKAYSLLYLGLLPALAQGFSEPESAFAAVLSRCAPSCESIEAERAWALGAAAAAESRRRLAAAPNRAGSEGSAARSL